MDARSEVKRLEEVYWSQFVIDYESSPIDQRIGQYRSGMETVLIELLGQKAWDEFYQRFNERRKIALEKFQILPHKFDRPVDGRKSPKRKGNPQ